jgi:hypothetical protein
MEPAAYERFTADLDRALQADPRVLALVAVGSMAGRDPAPDRWSDHDFFVVVTPGEQESFRTDLAWLPGRDQIAFSYRETAHGVKVVFRDGHLVEFAVFDPDELAFARINRYRLLFDRERIGERLARVARATVGSAQAAAPADDWLVGQFLTNLLVGVGRHCRGEKLSGRQFVKTSALTHLIVLLAKHLDSPARGLLDSLDPFRRFERVFPSLGRELDAILEQDTPDAARALLNLAVRELPERFPSEAVEVVRVRLASDPGSPRPRREL